MLVSFFKNQISYMIKLFFLYLFLVSVFSCNDNASENEHTDEVNKEVSFRYQLIDSGSITNPWAKITGDINGDGAMDIIIGGQKGPLVWYRNPDWKMFRISSGGYNTVDGEAGDIDGDGDFDIVMGGLFWYENPGSQLVTQQDVWDVHEISEHPTHDIELADFNNDGLLDVITRNQSDFGTMKGNTIHLWANNGEGGWTEKILECEHGEGLNVIDLDSDGDPDVIGTGIWFENADSGNWIRHDIIQWHASSNLAVADLNEDRRLDIVMTPSELAGQHFRISWFEQPEDIAHDIWQEHTLVDSIECVIHGVAVGDFNSDKAMDIAYSEMHQGEDPDEVVVLINLGKGQNWGKLILSEKGSHSIEAADVNGDNIPDILGANWSGDYQPVEVWYSDN